MGLGRNEIAAQLRQEIASGEYEPKNELPSYRDLANRLGAATNTVGEAVRLLATEGLVITRDKRPAKIRAAAEAENVSPEERQAVIRNELTNVQGELREVRARITDLDKRVTGLISELDAD